MKTKLRWSLLVLVLGGSAFGPGCGHIEIGVGAGQPTNADDGGQAGMTNGGAAGSADGDQSPTDREGGICTPPDESSWAGCYVGQPCFVCAAAIEKYPLYLLRHPHCGSFYACDHGPQSGCSPDCPKPGGADQCDGRVGTWAGCRGLGCYVCSELVADYPKYFINHPFCLANPTCGGTYATCSPACPEPTDDDKD
jgi:hypothetical protein